MVGENHVPHIGQGSLLFPISHDIKESDTSNVRSYDSCSGEQDRILCDLVTANRCGEIIEV